MVQIVDMLSEDWASLPYLDSAFVNLKIYGLEETPICSAGITSEAMLKFISPLPRCFVDSEKLQHFRGWSVELGQGDVADVADFSSAFVGGVVAAHA